jgi:hypothetical protein
MLGDQGAEHRGDVTSPRPKGGRPVATLHIEHPITDLDTWLQAFDGFAAARREAGVTSQRIQRPVDDQRYIVVDLEFETVEAATAFKAFLESVVWKSPDLSPGLAGTPRARVLELVDSSGDR